MINISHNTQFLSADNQFSEESEKKSLAMYKRSNIRSMLPPIEMPSAKRSIGFFDDGKLKSKSRSHFGMEMEGELGRDGDIGKKPDKEVKFDLFKVLEKEMKKADIKKYLKIAKILSHLYNETQTTTATQERDRNLPKYKVYSEWELNQIQQNYKDTNLGDFIIKIVNPDLLPKEYKKKKKIQQDGQQGQNYMVDLFQAMEKYDQLFNTENATDKNLQDCQKQAFQIAFYLLNFQQKRTSKEFLLKISQFIKIFEYMALIIPMTYQHYIQQKKNIQFKEMEQKLQNDVSQYRKSLDRDCQTVNFEKGQIESKFNDYKLKLYNYLRSKLLGVYQYGDDKKFLSSKQYIAINGEDIGTFFMALYKRIKSISQILKLYPELTRSLIEALRQKIAENSRKGHNSSNSLHRKLFSGGYLSRISHQGQLKWILNQQRPSDVLTLTRKFIIYRLNCRGGLFIRSFLSREQNYIYLVIKASEQHLQKMAQQSNFNMEIELGSVDIFSFEPVDKYGRPLRCNKYLRDIGFIKKYNLSYDKEDKDQDLGAKSVESQALNLYKKAIKMNKDELRAKIILDQEECDSCFVWLSTKTNTRFIQPDTILNNSYNGQEIESDIWPIYHIYVKIIVEYLKKLKLQFEMQKKNKYNIEALNSNIGLMLRLMFLKALDFCNNMYLQHRKARFKRIRNLFVRKHPLQTIWNQIGEDVPRGYYPYFYSEKLQQIWRKYEINEQKDRSKFSPASRLIITNKIIREYLNISKSLMEDLITDFYPIHDPYILKHIKVRPYLNVLSSMIEHDGLVKVEVNDTKVKMSETFVEYECEYTKQDFTKDSMQDKLKFRCKGMTDFSVNSVAFYCGEKLAFFFQFRRYLTEQAWPLCIVTIIIQILFWVENTHIEQSGTSSLTTLNNVLMIIMVIINTLWTQKTVNQWRDRQKKMARSFGTNQMNQKSQSHKRVLFEGEMKRNLQTNQINDEHENKIITTVKQLISLLINLIFVILMAATILIIFTLKGELYQRGYTQTSITLIPAILVALSTEVFNFIYSKIIGILVEFQNKKTIHQYENSLTSKSFIITFVVTYFALFIYGFFESYFDGETVCSVKIQTGQQITNCYYYISNQLVVSVILDLLLTIIMAFKPLLMFYYTRHMDEKHENDNIAYNLNYFESIDCFYEEQDKMQTYMYTDEIDRTWEGYTAVVISFTTLVLFAPIVPFLYVMMFFNGVVSLNAKKYEIIYFSKRTLPIRVKSIGIWLNVIRGISVVGVFINVALIIYVRNVITEDKAIVFFSCVFLILVIKYLMSFGSKDEDVVGKRCKARTREVVSQKEYMSFGGRNDQINNDIENLYYDERKLRRKLPVLKEANVRYK